MKHQVERNTEETIVLNNKLKEIWDGGLLGGLYIAYTKVSGFVGKM